MGDFNDLTRNQLIPPGGLFQDLVGAPFTSVVNTFTHMIHQVNTTATITTLNPPDERSQGHSGPNYLVAGSVFSWTTSGNIAAPPGTTLVANRAYGFIYQPRAGTWNPFGQDS